MKKYIFYWIGLFTLATACNDDFMEKYPQTDITAESFFNTPDDLKSYITGLYRRDIFYLRNNYDNDVFTDNMANRTTQTSDYNMLRGSLNKENADGWKNWDYLREVNFFLVNAGKAVGDQEEINHFIGIGRYFRAMFYINRIQQYSNVPWYNKPLSTTDEDLYKPADPRTLVADSIIADLEYASAHIKPELGNRTAINKYCAQLLLARFCLQEGTTRKYRSELSLGGTADALLSKAAATAQEIIESNVFQITGNGTDGYSALFTSADLSGNAEIILMGEYTLGKGNGNSSFHGLYGEYGLSRTLVESYLMTDGSRFTDKAGYATKEYKDMFTDRDPRMAATVQYPGFCKPGTTTPYNWAIHIKNGGYEAIKYYPRTLETLGAETWSSCYNDLPVYRYAEALLIYAEAKAETGALTQDDLDLSVNKLRARVGMPSLNLAAANSNIDPALAAQYSNVSGANRGVILEIRRERRVEMALEGTREQDLYRWACGKLLEGLPQGSYIPQIGLPGADITGDSQPDYVIFKTKAEKEAYDGNLPSFSLEEATNEWYLSAGDHGFIMFSINLTGGANNRKWEDPKYYYRPIPVSNMVTNPKLENIFGW
ncbi:MAG: RagB/SusD family nutrient uptake outer membrane protein [Tannerellaceae bacterium]|jgi:hypothetical protein|nr:RagB/SusD family nutrient uptake outer membrane protein [Tannerellaceae bacterium]